ncbi:hypothetical protein OA107_01775 [Candidatus Pelagibacter sp.]|nr:hypothetical protein [Candidatus Pelagibacter sp.]
MRFILLLLFILSACTYNKTEIKNKKNELFFSNNMNIEEFKIQLEKYANEQQYPNIDN